ncbi:MAG: minor capsid protein [Lachnospiraceae bacterium]
MSSKDYWARREEEALKSYIKDEKEYDKQIKQIYLNMLDACQQDIDSFYSKFASKEGITIAEAKKRVSKLDIAEYERKAKRYVEAAEKDRKIYGKTNANGFYFSKEANDEMRIYNATMRINRLEMLKSKIGLELLDGHDKLDKFMADILQERTATELKRQAGILGKSVLGNAQKAHAIPNASFHNATFSERLWSYQEAMKADISKLLQQGLIQGKSSRELAKDLKKYYIGDERLKNGKSGARYRTETLMRTELARVQIEAQKQSFERNGFTEYEFIANSGCCEICQALNGKHFKVKDMMPGLNAPPMHPRCRCSTAAYSDDTEYEAWLDYLDKGGSTAEWNDHGKAEWKKSLLQNSSENSKMKSKIEHSEAYKEIINGIKANKIQYNEVSRLNKELSSDEIVNRLAGGDMTRGSCSSLGFAYIGNKCGLDVLDFRDGTSRSFFASLLNIKKMLKLPNIKGSETMVQKEISGAIDVLKNLERGKEYYFSAGRHAAIVRNTENGPEYLELQSGVQNGWTSFDKYGSTYNTLYKRFGCRKTVDKMKIGTQTVVFEKSIVVMDVNSFKNNEEFEEILGYINTDKDKQKKGAAGNVK